MHPRYWRLTCLDDNKSFMNLLAGTVLLLFAWSAFTTLLIQHSHEAIISSGRLVVETTAVFMLFALRHYIDIPKYFSYAVVGLACINSVVVIIQLMEGVGCLTPRLSWIITGFWQLPVDEWTRKLGLFNGVQTSSLLSFIAMAMMAGRRDHVSLSIMALCLFPLFFGSRTLLIFMIPYLLYYWRVLLRSALLLGFLMAMGGSCGFDKMVSHHFEYRFKPTAAVILNVNPNLDYSTIELQTHYHEPTSPTDWILGNGYPRFSPEGGKDPTISRWLLQTGVPGLLLALAVSGLVCWRILRKGNWGNAVFALALAASMVKAELITSTAIYSILLLYGLSPIAVTRKPTTAPCSTNPS